MKSNPYVQEIEKKLREAKQTDKTSGITDLKKYIGTSYDFIGLTVPAQRSVFKKGYSFSHLPPEQQFLIWDALWKTAAVYETLTQAIFFAEKNKRNVPPFILWNYIRSWVSGIDNWAHSDGLSDLYAFLLEEDQEMVYPQLILWNVSENPWERRQSILSLLEYSKKRKKVLPVSKILPLIQRLIPDEHVFVQKAVGWSLRETGNVYPDETWQFLLKHCTALSPAAFVAATEKRSAEDKEFLKSLRKKNKLTKLGSIQQ
jgi:3-methyladenine DNA glycosylase AlkD